jgi:hypothetical protein
MSQPVLKKLFQFSADQLPTLKQQMKWQEEKVRAAAPDPAHVRKLTNIVAKAQAGIDVKLCVTFKLVISFL